MRKLFLFSLSSLLWVHSIVAQNTEEDLSAYLPVYAFEFEEIKNDSIHLVEQIEQEETFVTPTQHVNEKVATMLAKLKLHNEELDNAIQGFRVQLYSGNDMDSAIEIENKIKAILVEKESEHLVYRNYHAPTWKVRVGDFIERLDAHRLHHTLKDNFPTALILPDSEVNIRKIK